MIASGYMTLSGTRSEGHRRKNGWTLPEILIAVAIGSMVLVVVGALTIYGLRSFVAIGNYTDLDAKSRGAMDRMSREIRQASSLIGYQTNAASKWIMFTNSDLGFTVKYVWDAGSRKLTCEKIGQSPQVYLTECDRWDFTFYQRTPQANKTNVFYPATNNAGIYDLRECKLIDMTWKCSRTLLGKKWNTESVQTAQIVLRNQ